jgi:hypothetical protein
MWMRSDVSGRRLEETKPKRRGGRLLRFVLLAPLRLGWWMASKVERSTGILFTLLIGAGLLVGGFFLCSTFIGMVLGIPMIVAGGFLALRALY